VRTFWLGFLALFCGSSSCLDPTEVDVTLTTDLRCVTDPDDGRPPLASTDVQVLEPDGMWKTVGSTSACAKNNRIGDIVFVPGAHREVHLRAVGRVPGHDDLKAMRILKFVDHQKLDLEVALEAACVGVPCRDDQTCIMGKCMDPPVIGGTDAGTDASIPLDAVVIDAPLLDRIDDVMVIKDSGPDIGPYPDAGFDSGLKCPPPATFTTVDYRWRFDEGMGAMSTSDDSSNYTAQLLSGFTLVASGPCVSALDNQSTSKLDLVMTKWIPSSDMLIAFYVTVSQGSSGIILQRSRGVPGGWDFSLSNSTITFNLYFGSSPVPLTGALLAPNSVHSIAGQYSGGNVMLYVDKMLIGKTNVGQMLPPISAEIFVGATVQNSNVVIDELTFGH
jgi:hypothetical protein